ncbi:MAG: hypothetical protein NT175_02505 [Bacteroidetes bacterium]|nr:hypothetical protein [Bacteroidota bacterium]
MFIFILFTACRKEEIIDASSGIKLEFSNDTVIFDTVFTTIGSSTQVLQVYNRNENKVRISSIRLAGNNSLYDLNIDGIPADNVNDIEIAGHDSIYIFIRVTIDPNDQSNPFIVSDSIVFETNGNIQDVNLVAYGQNAHFFSNTVYQTDDIWENDKPYVIYGFIIIDSSFTLTIKPGARIFMHYNAVFAVAHDATLKVQGTVDEPVTFQGDRLEDYYLDLPGQWGMIWLSAGSKDNEIDYAIIKNGLVGLRVDTLGSSLNPTLRLSNTQIMNMTGYGLLAQGSHVVAGNCVFSNCGESAVVLSLGGTYDFRHCTIGNFWNYTVRESSSLVLNNYYLLIDDQGHVTDTIARDIYNAYFGNCIIYGYNDNEVYFSKTPKALFNYSFDHCLVKTAEISGYNYQDCIFNEDPYFTDYAKYDLSIDTLISPVINYGSLDVVNNALLNIQYDIDGIDRTADGEPDVGAYEFVPGSYRRLR